MGLLSIFWLWRVHGLLGHQNSLRKEGVRSLLRRENLVRSKRLLRRLGWRYRLNQQLRPDERSEENYWGTPTFLDRIPNFLDRVDLRHRRLAAWKTGRLWLVVRKHHLLRKLVWQILRLDGLEARAMFCILQHCRWLRNSRLWRLAQLGLRKKMAIHLSTNT